MKIDTNTRCSSDSSKDPTVYVEISMIWHIPNNSNGSRSGKSLVRKASQRRKNN